MCGDARPPLTRVGPHADIIDVALCRLNARVVGAAGQVPDLDDVRVGGDDAAAAQAPVIPLAGVELDVQDPERVVWGG